MRNKISQLFGFYLGENETYSAYLTRMDKIGSADQFRLLKLLMIICEEMDVMNANMGKLAVELGTLKNKKPVAKAK